MLILKRLTGSNSAWGRELRAGWQNITNPWQLPRERAQDPRFQFFHELPEDSYEAFLSVPLMCRGRLVGAINLQHRHPHTYKPGKYA